MEITILGSGTATPSLKRNASGLAIKSGGVLIVVDMGPGTIRRMCEADIDYRHVDAIAITHFHPDHVSDIVPFLFAANYAFGPIREEPFFLIGPDGLDTWCRSLVAVHGDWIVPRNDRLKIRELNADGPDSTNLDRVKMLSVPSEHSAPSLSYRIEDANGSVTLSGDTDITENLVELAKDTDVLVCECSMPEGRKVPGHLVPSEAGAMAARAGAGKLVLTHMYPPCEEADVAAQAATVFSGEVVKAEDLMRIVI
jgi:ribonuclease BN (tRNA processing enzyme)